MLQVKPTSLFFILGSEGVYDVLPFVVVLRLCLAGLVQEHEDVFTGWAE